MTFVGMARKFAVMVEVMVVLILQVFFNHLTNENNRCLNYLYSKRLYLFFCRRGIQSPHLTVSINNPRVRSVTSSDFSKVFILYVVSKLASREHAD